MLALYSGNRRARQERTLMGSRARHRTAFTTLTIHDKWSQRNGDLLLAEAESAHSSLSVAEAAADAERAFLNAEKARQALGTISALLDAIEFDLPLRCAIEAARDELQSRLALLERRYSLQ
jgi:hypothetical protein